MPFGPIIWNQYMDCMRNGKNILSQQNKVPYFSNIGLLSHSPNNVQYIELDVLQQPLSLSPPPKKATNVIVH